MTPSEKFAIIADDYTGACDSGIHFSRAGRQVDLLLRGACLGEQLRHSSSVSLTTESRFMSPERAALAVEAAIRQCQAAGFGHFFKKIDSTLRGNAGSEIESALKATGRKAALVCTAMPETGRTCVDGNIYLGNLPLHKTDIGGDPFHPVSTSSVVELLGRQTSLPAGTVSIQDIEADEATLAANLRSTVDKGFRLIVADAVTDSHLQALARQINAADFLPVGAGGFAKALAESHKRPGQPDGKRADIHTQGPILAVIGSLSGVSRRQAELACESGSFRPFDIQLQYGQDDIEKEFSRFLAGMGPGTKNILLRVSNDVRPTRVTKEEALRVARLLGDAAAVICRRFPCRTVFSTGGSTSMGVARALGIRSVNLVDEIMPGVVLGSCTAPDAGVEWFISKAGGFGDREILQKIAAGIPGDNRGV